MQEARRPLGTRAAALALAGSSALLVVGALVLVVLNRVAVRAGRYEAGGAKVATYVFAALAVAAYEGVGTLIAIRLPRNPIGWLLGFLGLVLSANLFFEQYGLRGLATAPGSLPAVKTIVAFAAASSNLTLAPLLLVVLLFPNGRLPSNRWRPVLWGAVEVAIVGGFGLILEKGILISGGLTNALADAHVQYPNPLGVFSRHGWYSDVLGVTGAIGGITAVLAIASVFVRRRRGSPELRQQLAWLGYIGVSFVTFAVVALVYNVASRGADTPIDTLLFGLVFGTPVFGIPVACAVAVLKYRLYDLDVVVKRTVVFGVLVAAFTSVYALIVLGVGALVGHRGNTGLTFAAAVLAAVLLQPLRTRAHRLADRLVYGKRATPYEVLSDFSERMAGTYSTDDVLPRMARMLVEATGGERAEVWLRLDSSLRREAVWPEGTGVAEVPSRSQEPLSALDVEDGLTRVFPVEHQGDVLGALRMSASPREPLSAAGERLVRDLAAQAGLVLRNVRLIEDLRASRQRIVAAGDEARRRLERNLHDGAQQQLVALRMKLGLARRLLGTSTEKADQMLEQTERDAGDALEELRDLARGIYPPLLADQGLPAALSAQARKAAVPVTIDADGVGRYPQEVEAAVYFSVLEALQNLAKYAQATTACITLREDDGALQFRVVDDGRGFDPSSTAMGTGVQGIGDRLAALGGGATVDSAPGEGTTVRGLVPVGTSSPA